MGHACSTAEISEMETELRRRSRRLGEGLLSKVRKLKEAARAHALASGVPADQLRDAPKRQRKKPRKVTKAWDYNLARDYDQHVLYEPLLQQDAGGFNKIAEPRGGCFRCL